MSDHIIKFYPVDNGDTTLIKLKNKTTILFDCKIRSNDTNSAGYDIFDVKADLLNTLEKRDSKPFLDMFTLTHPDEDHCLGFENHFYQGNTEDYNDDENELIIIDELWVTPMIFTNNGVSNNDAKAIRKEARRRKKLYDDNDDTCNDRGNRLIVVGYDGEDKLDNIPHYCPSDIVDKISGVKQDLFSLFIHAPLKEDLITGRAEKDKNTTSIVVQARFKIESSDTDFKTRVLLGGDADHYNWEKILEKTEKHGNEESLKWDLFLAPHHCSWTYFNDVPYGDKESNKTPKDYSIKILSDYQLAKGQIIASSKLIKNNEDNPPHYQAKSEYVKQLDSKDCFIALAESPKPSKTQPVIFKITSDGLKRTDDGANVNENIESATVLGASSAVSGNWCKS